MWKGWKKCGKRFDKSCGLAQGSSQNRSLLPLPKDSLVYERKVGQGLRDAFPNTTMWGRGEVSSVPTTRVMPKFALDNRGPKKILSNRYLYSHFPNKAMFLLTSPTNAKTAEFLTPRDYIPINKMWFGFLLAPSCICLPLMKAHWFCPIMQV